MSTDALEKTKEKKSKSKSKSKNNKDKKKSKKKHEDGDLSTDLRVDDIAAKKKSKKDKKKSKKDSKDKDKDKKRSKKDKKKSKKDKRGKGDGDVKQPQEEENNSGTSTTADLTEDDVDDPVSIGRFDNVNGTKKSKKDKKKEKKASKKKAKKEQKKKSKSKEGGKKKDKKSSKKKRKKDRSDDIDAENDNPINDDNDVVLKVELQNVRADDTAPQLPVRLESPRVTNDNNNTRGTQNDGDYGDDEDVDMSKEKRNKSKKKDKKKGKSKYDSDINKNDYVDYDEYDGGNHADDYEVKRQATATIAARKSQSSPKSKRRKLPKIKISVDDHPYLSQFETESIDEYSPGKPLSWKESKDSFRTSFTIDPEIFKVNQSSFTMDDSLGKLDKFEVDQKDEEIDDTLKDTARTTRKSMFLNNVVGFG